MLYSLRFVGSVICVEETGLRQGLRQGLCQGLRQGLRQVLRPGLRQVLRPGLRQGLLQALRQGLRRGLLPGLRQGHLILSVVHRIWATVTGATLAYSSTSDELMR